MNFLKNFLHEICKLCLHNKNNRLENFRVMIEFLSLIRHIELNTPPDMTYNMTHNMNSCYAADQNTNLFRNTELI
jgi:hypothetical protein